MGLFIQKATTTSQNKVTGINIIGLKRANYSKDEIRKYSNAVDTIFTGESISKEKNNFITTKSLLIKDLLVFLNKKSSRGICKYEK